MLPLAGSEEFDEEDNEKLPLDLQYLSDDKKREGDAVIRKILVEALFQVSKWYYIYFMLIYFHFEINKMLNLIYHFELLQFILGLKYMLQNYINL